MLNSRSNTILAITLFLRNKTFNQTFKLHLRDTMKTGEMCDPFNNKF